MERVLEIDRRLLIKASVSFFYFKLIPWANTREALQLHRSLTHQCI